MAAYVIVITLPSDLMRDVQRTTLDCDVNQLRLQSLGFDIMVVFTKSLPLRSSLGFLIQAIPSVVQGPQQWKPYLKAMYLGV